MAGQVCCFTQEAPCIVCAPPWAALGLSRLHVARPSLSMAPFCNVDDTADAHLNIAWACCRKQGLSSSVTSTVKITPLANDGALRAGARGKKHSADAEPSNTHNNHKQQPKKCSAASTSLADICGCCECCWAPRPQSASCHQLHHPVLHR